MTKIDVDNLKKSLRAAMPSEKSSYLTEAIAFGLGFKTHAALMAAFKDGKPVPDVLDGTRFGERLAELQSRGV